MNRRHAAEAAKKNKLPYVMGPEELEAMPPFPFPLFGDYEPEGWEPLDIWFCDATGGGGPGEPALTVNQFKRRLKKFFADHEGETIGFAVIEAPEGEMQVHVQAFRKERTDEDEGCEPAGGNGRDSAVKRRRSSTTTG